LTFPLKYKYSHLSLWFTAATACLICCFYTWQHPGSVNLLSGDARYYYIYLQNTFIDQALINYDWLDPANGVVITHHPAGLGILWLPFFLVALLFASVFNFPPDGVSLPFQVAVSAAALVYCITGLVYLKKLLQLNQVSDKVTALLIALIFFGTNLFHYTINESGMSHVYSFCLITVFLYHGCKLVQTGNNKNLWYAALIFGLVVLVRPNNGLIIFSLLFWFSSKEQCITFFRGLLLKKYFYYAVIAALLIIAVQPLTWLWKEDTLFVNRYATYGFYWLNPHLFEMLFGFDAGFFVYTPLCFLFLFGFIALYRENKYLFFSVAVFIFLLFYIFASYSAYTYYDGLGIRVLIDYYALFAMLGAKLFMHLGQYKVLFNAVGGVALFMVVINLIYCYQGENNILARAGMNYNKWKYIFLKTGKSYEGCLGGSNDLPPFSKHPPLLALHDEVKFNQPFDFSDKEFGPALFFDSIGFNSKRVQLKLKIRRKEGSANSSKDVLVCAMLEGKTDPSHRGYLQFRLNETPSAACCDDREYNYNANMEAQFKASDHLTVYLWNLKKQAFSIDEFSVQVYNYNY